MKVKLAYGESGLIVDVPNRNLMKILRMNGVKPLADVAGSLQRALQKPIGSPSLMQVAAGKTSACVVICDITRPVPNRLLLPPILQTIHSAEVRRDKTTILVATGTHRPNLGDELEGLVGKEIAKEYRVVNHYSERKSEHTYLGKSSRGVEIWLDTRYMESELKVLVGFIEPHLMAGFSGGRKLVVPGISGDDTLRVMHGAELMGHPDCREGIIEGNPFHEEALEIAHKAGVDFTVSVSLDEQKRVTGIFAGDLEAAHAEGVEFVRSAVRDHVDHPADIVLTTSGGAPLDATFYQAVKGLTAAAPIVKQGGTIIIAAECKEGLGSSEFSELYGTTQVMEDFMSRIYDDDYFVPDQWQFQKLGLVLRKAKVKLFSDRLTDNTRSDGVVEMIDSVEVGVSQALREYGSNARIAAIPQGPYVLAELSAAKGV